MQPNRAKTREERGGSPVQGRGASARMRGCNCVAAMDHLSRACVSMAPLRMRVGRFPTSKCGSNDAIRKWTTSRRLGGGALACTPPRVGQLVGTARAPFATNAWTSRVERETNGTNEKEEAEKHARDHVLDGEDPTPAWNVLQEHLHLYNSLGRTKEKFRPIAPGKVMMYVCGVTVYDHAHVGHARAYVAFDVLYRVLKKAGYEVQYCRNVTDIDDKIINRAQERNLTTEQVAETYFRSFQHDMERLRCLPPTMEPRATQHIQEAVDMIERIIERGHGYHAEDVGDVYFAVRTLPDYGKKLAMREQEDNKAGAGQRAREKAEEMMAQAKQSATAVSSDGAEAAETYRAETSQTSSGNDTINLAGTSIGKRDAADFALWKAAKPGEPWWDSPWGRGRPGWHIECSSMVQSLLGQRIDIHGGGVDLMFPHHENEIAQCEASCGCETTHRSFSNFWMHNGFVNVDSEKMSKSLGNFFTIREVLQNYHSLALRWFLIGTHYRSAINYTQRALEESSERTYYLYQTIADARKELSEVPDVNDSSTSNPRIDGKAQKQALQEGESISEAVADALADDLNTPLAIGAISQPLKVLNDLLHTRKGRKSKDRFVRMSSILKALESALDCLGMSVEDPDSILDEMRSLALVRAGMEEEELTKLLEQRLEARQNKNFELSDAIRNDLAAQGIMLMDGVADGPLWKPATRELGS